MGYNEGSEVKRLSRLKKDDGKAGETELSREIITPLPVALPAATYLPL
jgi:hypothetical protein